MAGSEEGSVVEGREDPDFNFHINSLHMSTNTTSSNSSHTHSATVATPIQQQ